MIFWRVLMKMSIIDKYYYEGDEEIFVFSRLFVFCGGFVVNRFLLLSMLYFGLFLGFFKWGLFWLFLLLMFLLLFLILMEGGLEVGYCSWVGLWGLLKFSLLSFESFLFFFMNSLFFISEFSMAWELLLLL